MAEQSISVPTSGVITLNVALAAGSTISNSSSNSAIWVSANPAVTPGNGMRIGPKGSLQWTTDKTPCYAIADTGVTAPVSITISDNVAQLVNPVDIGVAVAAQLLQRGVPNVWLGDFLGDASMPNDLDVSKYASIQYQFLVFVPGVMKLGFGAPVPLTGLNMSMGDMYIPFTKTGYYSISLPVTGPFFNVAALGGINLKNHYIYGSNRPVEFTLNPNDAPYTGSLSNAWVVGQRVAFPDPLVTSGGMATFRMTTTGSIKGYFELATYRNALWTTTTMLIGDTALGHARPDAPTVTEYVTTIMLPPGVHTFNFVSGTTIAAGSQALLQIVTEK